jgi:hypothetical protein
MILTCSLHGHMLSMAMWEGQFFSYRQPHWQQLSSMAKNIAICTPTNKTTNSSGLPAASHIHCCSRATMAGCHCKSFG